jgi:O-antigen ligase
MGTKWQRRANGLGFLILLAIVVLAPLPFGANRPFFWFLFSSILGSLVIWWALTVFLSRDPAAGFDRVRLGKFWVEAAFMVILVIWFLVQATSLTPETWHHPVWAARELLATELLATDGNTAISAAPDETMDGLVRFLAYGATFFLAMQYGRDANRARMGLWAVALAGIVYGLYGLVVYLGGNESILWYKRWAYHESLTSTFINRNSFAAFGGMTLICCIALLSAVERRAEAMASQEGRAAYWERLAARGLPLFVGTIFILTAILLSRSRAGLLATVLGVGVFYFSRWQLNRRAERRKAGSDRRVETSDGAESRPRGRRGRKRFAPILLALTFVVAIVISGAATWKRVDKGTLEDAGGRMGIYSATLTAIAERPLMGHGYGSYRWVFEGYRTPDMLRADTVDKAHNSYLDFAFEAGVPAAVVLFLLLARIFIRCLIGVRRRERDSIYPAVAVATASLLAAHSLVDFPLQIPAITFLFLFLFGIGFAQSWSSRDS